jgi:hypothetical protein
MLSQDNEQLVSAMVWLHESMSSYGATPRHYVALVDKYAHILADKRKEVTALLNVQPDRQYAKYYCLAGRRAPADVSLCTMNRLCLRAALNSVEMQQQQ